MILSKTHIIIVDDDMKDDDVEVETLKEYYQYVHLFPRGRDFLNYLKNNLNQNNLIILDVQLPNNMNGDAVLKAIREISHLIPVIIFTNPERKEELATYLNNDANGFIGKRVSRIEFLNKVREVENIYIRDKGIASALEAWIYRQERDKLDEPYLIEASGKVYTLNDLLREIRLQTEVGRKFEKDAYDMLIDILIDKQTENNG